MDEDSDKSGLFRRVKASFQSGTKPGFLGGEGGGEAPSGSKYEQRANERAAASGAAADSLKDAEGSASGGLFHREDSLDAARADEQAEGDAGFYNNDNSRGGFSNKVSAIKDFKNAKFSSAFKKAGPVLGIFFIIFGVGGIMAGTQLFQPFSLIAQLQESYNSMHVSANTRSARFFKAQMDTGRVKDPIRGNSIFGKTLKISEKQQAELARQGIEYDEDYEGTGKRVLKYTGSDGEQKIVTADNFKDVYASDVDFFHKYNAGSMTWRGQFANWFGNVTNTFLKNNKLSRNTWKDFKTKKAEAGGDGMKVARETLEERAKGTTDIEVRTTEATEEVDEENGGTKVTSETSSVKTTGADVSEKLNKLKGKFTNAANAGCAVVGLIGAVSLMVAADEAMQILTLATSYMEAVDKTKAGYGDEAPINELTNSLNESATTTNSVIKQTRAYAGEQDITEGGIATLELEEQEVVRSAMQSAGMAALYGNGLVDPNDASVQSFNFSASMSKILGGVGVAMDSFMGCTIARAGAAAVEGIAEAGSVIACVVGAVGAVGTGGASAALCAPLIGGALASIAAGALLGVLLSGIISLITPMVTNMLTRNLIENLSGEDLGNAIVSGASLYQSSTHRANGGSLATTDKYKEFAVTQAQVIAEDAREERESLSPFDLTSKNTFLGTVMTKLMSFNTTSSLMSTLTSANTVVNSSLVALTPSTSAIASEIAKSLPNMDDYEKTCPYLASIDAIGDSYCNPYSVTDLDTIEMDPDEVIQKVDSMGGLSDIQEEGNVTINKDSRLAKYIRYCDNRTSPFGVADQDIVNEINSGTTISTGDSLLDGAGNGALGSIPVVGSVIDILEQGNNVANIGYISGQSCVAGGGDNIIGTTESPNWSEAKYYQRFIEDQSLAESMGIIEKSAVSVYLEEYYQENPLDNSYEGRLARYSGLDKETVSDILDVIAYYNYINAYDASERYAFGAPAVGTDDALQFEQENIMGGEIIALEGIVYADVRNRNFAA